MSRFSLKISKNLCRLISTSPVENHIPGCFMKDPVSKIRRLAIFFIVSVQIISLYIFIFVIQHKTKSRWRKAFMKKVSWINQIMSPISINQLLAQLGPSPVFAQNGYRNTTIPKHFPRLEQFYERMERLAMQHPELISLEVIGSSTTLGLPIYALRISDNPQIEEDESSILFSGLHHAREPMGTLMCLRIAEWLAANYWVRPGIKRLVDELEIWVVPVVNPDGYKYMLDNFVPYPWWRKNLRDNDRDGVFNPTIDGVDLNRNYDFNWRQGGEGNPASWFYRGEAPFSENEVAALKKLALRENIMAGISFHSYGEVVLFPWGNYYPAPDHRIIVEIASKLAEQMQKLYGSEPYSVLPLNGRVGQSSVWMYGRLRAIDYILELGNEHFPDRYAAERILNEGLKAIRYFLNRMLGAGIRGHVMDALEGTPVVATIRIKGLEADYVYPRQSEKHFGRFERLLSPGEYTLEVIAFGYQTRILKRVNVKQYQPTQIEIYLNRMESFPAAHH